MPLSSISCQGRAVEMLRATLRAGTVPHAFLFTGEEGVGKELTATCFAQALNCPSAPGEGCGTCSTCQRIERGNHPDVVVVMPEAESVQRGLAGRSDFEQTPSRDIRVDQVRKLQDRLALRALEAKHKVAIFAEAQALNPQAQNALLKTLEEPPSGAVLMLVASAPEKLLPTIRSRCVRVGFSPLPAEFLAQRVQEERAVDEATARLVAVMAGGSLSRALALDPKALEHRREVIGRFEELTAVDARGWLRFAEDFGDERPRAEGCIAILGMWLRDLALVRAGSEGLANRDLVELAREAATRWSDVRVHRALRLVDEARHAISVRNGAARLQLERLLIELHGA